MCFGRIFNLIIIVTISACSNYHFHINNLNNDAISILGHRGSGVHFLNPFPENTIVSIDNALRKLKIHGVEIDINNSSNILPVLYHDEKLSFKTNCSARVCSKSIAELKNCFYQGDFRYNFLQNSITSLEDVFKRYNTDRPKLTLWLDIKFSSGCNHEPKNYAKEIIRLKNVLEVKQDLIIFTSNQVILNEIRRLEPNLKFVLKTNGLSALKRAVQETFWGVLSQNGITSTEIKIFHRNNIRVVLFGDRSKDDLVAMASKSPDAIITNQPRLLQELLYH